MDLIEPLFDAVVKGDEAVVQHFLGLGASLRINDEDGLTALHWAASSVEGEKLVPFLVEAGANVNAKDNAGRSPLHLHCARGRVYAIACLLHLGADVDCADTEGATPRSVAAQHGQEEVQRILLGYGASLPYDSGVANIGLSGSDLPPSSSSSASVG